MHRRVERLLVPQDKLRAVVHDRAYLFILLFFFQFPFFLGRELRLFLLFPFAFIFTSLITHIYFSVIENECSTATTPFYRVD